MRDSIVVIGWVLFRSDNFEMAFHLIGRMLVWHPGNVPIGWQLLLGMLVLSAGLAHFAPNTFELSHKWNRLSVAGLALLFLTCMTVIYGGQRSPFLYFQF
jgi:alginate O-acetyltransferase complex protein AlgI